MRNFLLAAAVAGGIYFLYRRGHKSKASTVVSSVVIYPIKSCKGVECSNISLDKFGVAGDRGLMVVNETGNFQTQRQSAKMCLITPTILPDGRIRLSAPDIAPIVIDPSHSTGKVMDVRVWDHETEAVEVSAEASKWMSDYLGEERYLVRRGETFYRTLEDETTFTPPFLRHRHLNFADGFQALLATEESLADLNTRLPEPISMNRFRANIVIKGCVRPFEEDTWKRIRIGKSEFLCVKPCTRCKIPATNQETGERTEIVTDVLNSFRKVKGNGKLNDERVFAVNLIPLKESGTIAVGDALVVLETQVVNYFG